MLRVGIFLGLFLCIYASPFSPSFMGNIMNAIGRGIQEAASPLEVPRLAAKHIRNQYFDMAVNRKPLPGNEYKFVPDFIAALRKGSQISWKSKCYESNIATIHGELLDSRVIKIESSKVINSSCVDFYWFGTIDGLAEVEIHPTEDTKTTEVPLLSWTVKGGKEWYENNGIYVFQFVQDRDAAIGSLLDTVALFIGDAVGPEDPLPDMEYVIKFLEKYANISYTRRPQAQYLVDIDPATIKSGTVMGCLRPDGLGSLEMWATGAHTSHWVLLIRGNDGQLYVVESTDKTAYWSIPNIQMNPWDKWIPMSLAANYSIVMFPLNAEKQAQFDSGIQEAWKFINSSLGLPYGYHNFLWGVFDTPTGNLPYPISIQFFELLTGILEKLDHAFASRLFNEAMSFRMTGSWKGNYTMAELINMATGKGLTFGQLISIPEQDDWVYSDGPSMVCNVFCCHIYKAAGLFGELGSSINCVEEHNRDFYSLNFFDLDKSKRPQVCQQADPDLDYCMLMGPWSMTTPQHNTVAPYAHMYEKCAAQPPAWVDTPKGC